MSLYNRDEAFICALKKYPEQRSEKDLQIIFSRLHRFEALSNLREHSLRALCRGVRYERHDANEILYGKDDPCECWFILLTGAIFIQGSMFLRNTSFGKQIPGTNRRGSQCLVLEPSEMIAIDYPEMHPPLHTGAGSVQVPNLRNHSSSTSSRSTLDSVAEASGSSAESSPSHNSSRKSSRKMANGKAVMQADSKEDIMKNTQAYFADQEDSRSHEDPEQDDQQSDMEEEQEDSISLHSSSSLVIRDLVTEVMKKDIADRNEDDNDVLLEFTRSLQAFSNMTEPIRRELCKVMVFAQVEKAGTELLKNNELLDSWSVIINGQVQVIESDEEARLLYMGESFGVTPFSQPQYHKGTMYTMTEDCQFLCIAQQQYCEVLLQGKENMENVFGEDGKIEMVKEKREIEGGKKGHIVIRGTPPSLRYHLLEENSIDTTYAEDYLLTYRAFCNEPVAICSQLLNWFDRDEFKAKVTRVILLWVNNHFNDFECDRHMMELLEKFEEKLQKCNKTGECRLFNIACSTKAKSRVITLSRSSNEEDLSFSITGGTEGYPIYILQVRPKSIAEEKGLKRGDQLLNVNGQNFEKLNMERANTILRKNTDLTLTVKTNLFAFKEMMSDLKNPSKRKDKNKKGKGDDGPVIAQISTMQPRPSRMASLASEADIYEGKNKKEVPEDVIKVFRADQTYRFVFVNQDTTAEEAVRTACKEFGIMGDVKNFSLCRVTVQNENFVKQSKLPEKLANLSQIPLSARYYLKNNMESEQLLPDENIPELLKEANYSFLDLNCFEVALHLTLQDYELFKTVEQTDFIDDLFHLNEDNLSKFKKFEDLVNRELFWVVSTMCSEPNVLRRSKMVKHFTKIAHHCKTLKNLNSTFAIISGLGYRAVSRMKLAWEKVPAKCQRTFEDLQALMDPSRNMSKYRTLLNDLTSQPPVIPYIPVVKKDLTFLHLGNDTTVEDLVNFEKMRMIGREVRNVCRLCSAESSQIISSALAHHPEAENRPTSNIYHTLTRRGRRSSFNNARKMYEDAMNARRVKQYMQQLKIESDEDKLMEMSKQLEPAAVTSAQTKRRNTAMADSPSRSSKTLPNAPGKGVIHSRNNSEPSLVTGAGLSALPTKKKTPASSFPKFGTTSPQAIRKLLALSEESGDGGSSGGSKHGSSDQRCGGSSSSRELSPATSPYLSPKCDLPRSKGSISSSDSSHSVAHENTNRNNNRGTRPSGDRPVIMQGRSGSFGALSVTTISSDRRLPPSSGERRLTGSSSSPSLSARAASSHHHLILPNHPQIPRSPSVDSGVVSMGSLSADSTLFLNSEAEIFARPAHRSGASLASSEGFVSQQQMPGAASSHHQSPVMRRHLHNLQKQEKAARCNTETNKQAVSAGKNLSHIAAPTTVNPRESPHSVSSENASDGRKEKEDDIKQTFLSGSRGWGDAPLKRDKDPWPIGSKLPPGSPMTPTSSPGWPSPTSEDNMLLISEVRTNSTGNQAQTKFHSNTQPHPLKFAGVKNGVDFVDGPQPKSQRKAVISGTGPEIQQYYERLKTQERPSPPASLSFRKGPSRNQDAKTPEAILEEELLLQLQQQKPLLNKSFDSAATYAGTPRNPYGRPAMLCERHSMSFAGTPSNYHDDPGTPVGLGPGAVMHQLNLGRSDPTLHQPIDNPGLPPEYPSYPYAGNFCINPGCKCPASRATQEQRRAFAEYHHPGLLPSYNTSGPARTSSPKQNLPPVDSRGRVPDSNIFISDFGGPYPKTFVGPVGQSDNRDKYLPQENRRTQTSYPASYHCPKHGNPLLNPAVQTQYPRDQSCIPEHPHMGPLHNSTPDLPGPGYQVGLRVPYDHHYTPPPDESPRRGFSHSRSTSDVSLNSEVYNNVDPVVYNNSLNRMNTSHYAGLPNDTQAYPSPIGYSEGSHSKPSFFRETPDLPSTANTGRHSLGNLSTSSTPKSHSLSSHQPLMRRKSSEWGVTDLDKENQQQAMQVWTSGSTTNTPMKSAVHSKDNSSPDVRLQDQDPPLKTNANKKKRPPPLPPQRNSSYSVTRQLRLSSGNLSPLSSPPNSPTTPLSLSKLSLSESNPKLIVKTMADGVIPDSNPSPKQATDSAVHTRPLTQSNGVLPHMKTAMRQEVYHHTREQSSPRTLPSYNEALNHITSQSAKSSCISLPSYQNFQGTRDNKDQTSQV